MFAAEPRDAYSPLVALRRLDAEMARLHPLLEGAGIEVPDTDTAWTWLALAEELRVDGWQPA